MSRIAHLSEIGAGIVGKAVTDTLYVSPNGSNTNGLTWAGAYNTIQGALNAASTNGGDLTLICISPHENYYDIDGTGCPTYTGNYILKGSHRTWAKIKNDSPTAECILKFTGKTSLYDLNFNLGSGGCNGVIMSKGGFRVNHCQFIGENLASGAVALSIDNTSTLKYGIVSESSFKGDGTHMSGILIDNSSFSLYERCIFNDCATAIQIDNVNSKDNYFNTMDVGDCNLAFDINGGSGQQIVDAQLHNNTRNFDDEVGGQLYQNIALQTDTTITPDNFTGITLNTDAAADTWGADTEIIAANAIDNPFRIIGIQVEGDTSEKFRVRLSSSAGATYFDDLQVQGEINPIIRSTVSFSANSDTIFNANTRISGSVKSESGGNSVVVWLELQIL